MSITVHDVIIIGSGLAGLTAAHALKEEGLSVILLEREPDIGASWRRRHPQLTLNTHRDLSTLPDLAYPAGTGAFPKRDTVVAHLQAFAKRHAFDIRHGIDVTSVTREDGRFRVSSGAGDFLAVNVVVATGQNTDRRFPDWPGRETFTGRMLHAADFGNARQYAGQSILVIGGGNSGFDVLNHLSRIDTGSVWFSVRRGPSVLPKRLFRLSVHRLSPVMQALPTAVVDRLIAATQWLAFGNLRRLGFPPGSSDAATRLVDRHIAIPVDDGAISAIRNGRIAVVKAVRAFAPDGVELEDGTRLHPDVIIVAAGYGSSSKALAPGTDDRTPAGGLPGAERPAPVDGLWMIGMTPSLTSYFLQTRREAQAIAKAITKAKRV